MRLGKEPTVIEDLWDYCYRIPSGATDQVMHEPGFALAAKLSQRVKDMLNSPQASEHWLWLAIADMAEDVVRCRAQERAREWKQKQKQKRKKKKQKQKRKKKHSHA